MEHLYDAECEATPTTFCVTGATGFLGSYVVKRLLQAGHTVHATTRHSDEQKRIAHLLALPGASERLKIFEVSANLDG